ncbi:sensor histidine kinase [Mesorhizobium marinum]|uniref:sensor histidine kinase n=1 Tax=Mesorhizobium marinum TaxID=3228790 RepID=UPI0034650B10
MTRRLILWLTGVTVLLWLLTAGLGALIMREEFDEVFDSSLAETAQRLLPLVVEDVFSRNSGEGPKRLPHSPGMEDEEYLTFQVRDQDGAVLLHSHDAPAEPFAAPLEPGFADTPTHRIFTTNAVSGSIVLQVADPLAHRAEAMSEGLQALLLPLLALVPLSVIAVWTIVRRALRPIGALSAQIGARSGANLAPLAPGPLPPELSTIAHSVDDLLDRLRRTIEAERSFTANSAHELRTPIAGSLAQTQRLIEELEAGPARDRALQIERSLHGLSRLAEKLLQLARADAGIGLAANPVVLEPIVRMVAEEFSGSRAGGHPIDVVPARPFLAAAIDVDAFAIALRNLIENAVTHGAPDQPITVLITPHGVDVTNAGPVLDSAALLRLKQPFERAGAVARGTGLGLAIADALARAMGARLTLISPARGRNDGFQASLVFPEGAVGPAPGGRPES